MALLKSSTLVNCANCRAGNPLHSPYCSGCGAPISSAATPQSQPLVPASAAPMPPSFEAVKRKLLHEDQDLALSKICHDKALDVLISEEEIAYIATGSKAGLGHQPDCAVATNKRLLVFKKKMLGKLEFEDSFWRDISDVQMKDGRHGIMLVVDTIQGWQMTIDALDRAQASRLYQVARDHCERLNVKPATDEPSLGQETRPITSTHLASAPIWEPSGPLEPPTLTQVEQPSPAVDSQASPSRASGPLKPLPLAARSNSGKLHGITTSGPLQSGPLGPSGEEPIAVPSHQEVLQNLLRSSRERESQPLAQAAAFHAPPQAESREVLFEERVVQPSPTPGGNNVAGSRPVYSSAPLASGLNRSGPLKPSDGAKPTIPLKPGEPGPSQRSALNNGAPPQSARASGPLANGAPPARPTSGPLPASGTQDDPVHKMMQLKQMLDAGLINEEDYQSKKADILSRI